jgi:hypothetical protein
MEGLSDADENVRAYCLLALGLADDGASRDRLRRAVATGTPREATAAIWALARRPDGVEHVVAALDDSQPMRNEATGALLHVAAPLGESALARLEQSEQPELRAAAARNRKLPRPAPPEEPSFASILPQIEAVLGGPLEPAWRERVIDLNDVPGDILAAALRLSGVSRPVFLQWVIHPSQKAWLLDFMQQVLVEGAEVGRWWRGGALIPGLDLSRLFTMSVWEVLGVVPRMPSQPWQRVALRANTDPTYAATSGAPAVEHPHLTYRDQAPPDTIRVLDAKLVAVEDPGIEVRRWMASRLAGEAARVGRLDELRRTADPIATLFAGIQPSFDARIAAAAWQAEEQRLAASVAPAGFRGPDRWYAGILAE